MRRLMWFSIGFCVACLLSVFLLPQPCLVWAGAVGAGFIVGYPLLRKSCPGSRSSGNGRRRLFCALWGLALGLIWCWGYDATALSPARAAEGRYEHMKAELCGYPSPTAYGYWVDGFALVEGERIKTRFYLSGKLPELEPGDFLSGSFTLRRGDLTADGETRLDLQARGILMTASGRAETVARGGQPLRYLPARFSRRVFLRLAELLPQDVASLPQAMLTGDRSGLSEAERSAMSLAGASHVLAVSGLHVSMLVGILWLLTGRGRRGSLIGIPLLGFYVLMTGASPSVVRAAVMVSLLLAAPLFREERDSPTSLALAALLLLLWNPWSIANLSFSLSFAAVAGLLLVTPRLRDFLEALPLIQRLLRWQGRKKLPPPYFCRLLRLFRHLIHWFCGSIAASLGALAFTTPLAALTFGRVPVYGVLTNLLILFPATLCLGGALAVLALGLVWTELGALAGGLLAILPRYILWVCRTVARLPGSQLDLDGYGLGFLAFALLLLLLLGLLREKRLGLPLVCLLAALIGAVSLQRLEAARAGFTLAALDVGQGQCVCAVADSFTAVIDCGGSGSGRAGSDAALWLQSKGVTRVDALILTHYDEDHTNGVETLLSLIPVSTVYLPETDPEHRAPVEAAALAHGAALCYLTENRTVPFLGGELTLFAPVSDRSDNAACVSVLYSVGEYDMLVTGDLDADAERALLEREHLPPVELYVAGHHGSAGSSSEALLETIRPDTVLISVGRNNRYGLPSPETLDRFAALGAAVYRTDESGNLEIGR